MDFAFSAEQDAFRGAVRQVLAGAVTDAVFEAAVDDDRGFSDDFWQIVVDAGWTGVLVPEEYGGLGLGLVDAVVMLEETGRIPLPGPVLSSAVLSTVAARRLGADDLLADLATGAKRGTIAIDEVGAGDPLAGVSTQASEAADSWVLNGLKPAVLDGHTADWVIVLARNPSGLAGYLVDSPDAVAVPGLDPTRKIARLTLTDTPAVHVGPPGDQTALWRRIADDGAVALCAELTGVSERALELSTAYAAQREQFGRPIGAFQAIRHMAAEMLQRVELARVGVHYAAWTSDEDTDDRERSASLVKAWSAEAAIDVTSRAHQIHGGLGFTWDVPVHLLFKRAKVNDLLLGQQGWHRQRVADALLGRA